MAVAILAGGGVGHAQNPGTCAATTGSDPLMRSEGQTELTSSIVLVCNDVAPGSVNFDVTLNNGTVPITSRTNEATVTVDNGGVITTVYGTIVSSGGSALANTDMSFVGVPITSPSPSLTISGIRANVNPAYVPLGDSGFGEVLAELSVSGGMLPITTSGSMTVGLVFPGLGPVTVSGVQVNACGGAVSLGAGVNFTVNIPELFPTVFKIQGPNGDSDSETGVFTGALQADSATQFAVSLLNLPSGIQFYLPLHITSGGPGTAVLVTGPASVTPISTGLVTLDGSSYLPVPSNATYYYNVLSTNPGVTETFSIPLYNSAATFTSGFTGNVTVNLGPTAFVSPDTVPRFLGGAPTVGLGFTPTATVNPAALFADNTGGVPQVLTVVTPAPACTWSAYAYSSTGDSAWIQIAPTSGTGGGTMTVTLLPNTTGQDRTGGIQINNASVGIIEAFTAEVFTDVPPNDYYFDAVNLLSSKGVTAGCSISPPEYCPATNVTRAEMAVFIVTSIYGGDNFTLNSTTPYFNDVPAGSFGFNWIQKMYELGITSGCGNGDFCPNDSVSRAQMAVFIITARYGSTAVWDYPSTPYFTDVFAGAFAFGWIQRFRYDNITAGCGPNLFCPANPVTRGDMAIFIMKGMFNALFPPGTPEIQSISPASIPTGQPTTLTITGVNTDFDSTTLVNSIPGVTIGAVSILSATSLTVVLTPATDAVTTEPYSIYLNTPDFSQEEVLPNGLTLTP